MASKLKNNKSESLKRNAVICGIIYAAVGFITRIFSVSPFETIHMMGLEAYLPPMWIFNLLCIFWFFVCGTALGTGLTKKSCGRLSLSGEIGFYRGCIAFTSLIFLTLLWYPKFFEGNSFVFSLIISLIGVLCSAICAVQWRVVGVYEVIAMSANSVWLIYIFLVNLLTVLKC